MRLQSVGVWQGLRIMEKWILQGGENPTPKSYKWPKANYPGQVRSRGTAVCRDIFVICSSKSLFFRKILIHREDSNLLGFVQQGSRTLRHAALDAECSREPTCMVKTVTKDT